MISIPHHTIFKRRRWRFLLLPCCIGFALLLAALFANSQPTTIRFHQLGTNEGLNDGIVRCIAQDKFGYIWIGTVGAVNKFDGRKVEIFTNVPNDTTTPYGTQIRCMHSDRQGRFWVGAENGLMEYDFTNNRFIRIKPLYGKFTTCINSSSDTVLYVGSRQGLTRYSINSGNSFDYATSTRPEHAALRGKRVNCIAPVGNQLFVGTNKGLVILDEKAASATMTSHPELANAEILDLAIGPNGDLMVITAGLHNVVLLKGNELQVLDGDIERSLGLSSPGITGAAIDLDQQWWLISSGNGLLNYQPSKKSVRQWLYNTTRASGPSSNAFRCIFSDADGNMWLGCDTESVNYFTPAQNLFSSIMPFPVRLRDQYSRVGRAIAADKKGNIWMGNHDGLSRYQSTTTDYTIWRNEEGKPAVLHSNVVRSLCADTADNIWIGTAEGVNKYNAATGRIESISNAHLPQSFYNAINQDRSGNIWFSTNDSASLYWYNMAEGTYHSISEHPQLKRYKGYAPCSYVMEDEHQRLYISFGRRGVVMLDKRKATTHLYSAGDTTADATIIGDQVIDIKTDKNGIVWLATFSGISALDPNNNMVSNYTNQNGLPGNAVGALAVDDANRVWAGVNGGFTLIGADRKSLAVFSQSAGLPSVGFPEHAAVQLSNGLMFFPTYNGYFFFNPKQYKAANNNLRTYVSGYSVFDTAYRHLPPPGQNASIRLEAHENSFALHLSSLNYVHPMDNWFCYKLEGFDNDWHFTKEAKAVYTNVPGGNYTFLFKSALQNGQWQSIDTNSVRITVDTYFYKTAWFLLLVAALLIGGITWLYRYRTRQQTELYELSSKAKELEKEAAMVMYENLRQHLNPHFLFNSLTSLSGLIETNQEMAVDFLDQMSGIFRYILKHSETETVSIKDELNFVQLYINLQKTRFKQGLQVRVNVPEEYKHYKIAPVTLQNLIENAIKHNIIDADSPLLIEITVEEETYLVVQNNLQKKQSVETSNKKGLEQFASLYRYFSPLPVAVIETDEYFKIKIPLI